MRFRYWCSDSQGHSRDGVVEARSPEEARRKLRGQGFQVLVLEPEGPVRPEEPQAERPRGRLKADDRLMFHLQMSIMLRSGVPLTEAFEALAGSGSDELRHTAEEVAKRVAAGTSLSAAMGGVKQFSPVAISLVRVAERSGALTEMFARLAERLRRLLMRRRQLLSALTYPAVIALVCVLLLALLLGYMLPQFTEVFATLGGELPALTRFFINLSQGPWLPLLAALVLAAVGGLGLAYHRNEAARLLVQRLLYEAPLWGPLATRELLVRLTSDLALLVDLGVPVEESLGLLSRPSCGYYRADEALRVAQVELRATGDLNHAVAESGLFPPMLLQMVALGLETGRLGKFLADYSRLAEMEFESRLNDLLNLLEPLILALLGAGVGLVVLSAFLPMYKLLSQF